MKFNKYNIKFILYLYYKRYLDHIYWIVVNLGVRQGIT